ncbi:MAG: hypothetical protein ABI210_09355 [Abditibacteriaceae bacterium]
MKLYKNVVFAVLLVCLSTAFSSTSFAASVVKGVVINGSNNQNVAGLKVELRRSGDPGKSGKLIAATTSGVDGSFSFLVPKTEIGSLLVATATYQGYPYEVPAFDGGQHLAQFNVKIDATKVRLPVFQTTSSLVPLEVRVSHLNVKPLKGGLTCVEFLIINNPSKKTFLGIGPDKATILLDLPKGAKNVRLDPQSVDGKLNQRPDGYSISQPISPTLNTEGTAIIVDYDIDWPSRLPWKRTLDLTTEIQYPTRFFFVQRSADDAALLVSGPKLHADQSVKMNIEGKPIDSLINAVGNPQESKAALLPGDELKIQISSPINPTFWAFLGFLVLLIILIPLSLWRRSAAPSPIDAKADKMGEPVHDQSVYSRTSESNNWLKSPKAVDLVEQIAALDDSFAAGEIDEADYQAERQDCKDVLLQLASRKS